MAADDVSLRPIVLGPAGGANPFASFGKGAGFGIKAKKAAAVHTTTDDVAPKKDGKRIKYGKEYLMKFMERYTKCPLEVQQLGMTEIVISEESERDQQRQVLQKVAEDIDDRDWRTRDAIAAAAAAGSPKEPRAAPAPTATAAAGAPQREPASKPASKEADATTRPAPAQQAAAPAPAAQQPAAAPAASEAASKIVTAAEVGRQAYKPGAQLSTEERAMRTIKGILNKLTPEKFERLLQQLLEVITTADILKSTITLVFENAVEQPTYCAMYADLCLRLSKELPSFPPPMGSNKPLTFRQILLNTCQDEFEGTEAAREGLSRITEPGPREEAERTVKKRTMGNMRLISELYKQDMVKDWIMTTCMEDLLVAPKGKVPPEDNIEAACEMITTAGARLSKSERPETRKALEDVLKTLERLGADTRNVASRVRFLIKDVLELRRSNWVPRREVFTAKKLDEVRAQAEAELGLISSNLTAALPTLPTQQRMGIPGIGGAVDDIPLIPPLRGAAGAAGGDGDWGLFPPLRSQQQGGGFGYANPQPGSKSALLGDFQPIKPAEPAPAQQPAQAAAPVAAPAAPAGSRTGGLSEEELKRKSENLLQEYLSTLDKKEAVTCVRELNAPDWMSKLVEAGLDMLLNSTRDKEQAALAELLLHLHTQGLVSSEDLVSALTTYTVQLEDLSMDFPKAPQLLGSFLGQVISSGALGLETLPALLDSDFGVEPKRDFAAATFLAVQSAKGGAAGLNAACTEAGVHASAFLEADPTLDPTAPPVKDWLESKGLTAGVPL